MTESSDSQRDKEAPQSKFSHYLHLADGTVKRYAVPEDQPDAPLPTDFNGVRVLAVHNAY